MPRTFLKDAIMRWGTMRVTDHNRGELSVDVDRIETAKRMANGTLRKYVIADKRTWNTSWDDLPDSAEFTVDGYAGGREIEEFFDNNPGAFTLTVTPGNGEPETYTVVMTEFSKDIKRRGKYDFWDVSVELEEV